MCVTGWMSWGLATGQAAGIADASDAMKGALRCTDAMTESLAGRTGYDFRGGGPAKLAGTPTMLNSSPMEAMTSVGLMVRLFAGRSPANDPLIGKGAALILAARPKWDWWAPAGVRMDFHAWFWGSLAMRQSGGDAWKSWGSALTTALLAGQRTRKDGCIRGSWDPIDAWSSIGGRVYSTAMCCMALESYWRMDPLVGAK